MQQHCIILVTKEYALLYKKNNQVSVCTVPKIQKSNEICVPLCLKEVSYHKIMQNKQTLNSLHNFGQSDFLLPLVKERLRLR